MLFVELAEENVMFDLDDLAFIAELQPNEAAYARDQYQTRIGLRGAKYEVMLRSDYDTVKRQITLALRQRERGLP